MAGAFWQVARHGAQSAIAATGRLLWAEWDRFALWLPVFIGIGIGIYFALPEEPDLLWSASGLCLALAMRIAALRRQGLRLATGALAAIATGFFAATLNTVLSDAPILSRELGLRDVEGRIVQIYAHEDGAMRVVLDYVSIARLAPSETPSHVRISVRKGVEGLRPGDWIRIRAALGPPPQPIAPGAYDFGRAAYFDGLGGFGYAVAEPVRIDAVAEETLWQGVTGAITRLRFDISSRIRAAADERTGGIAAALISGDRSGIGKEDLQALRDSSLQHLLSISGLHMAIVGMGLFALFRFIGLAMGARAQEWPVKKIAAFGALAGSFFYLLLSGAEAPTQRSFFMIGLMFVAVMIDRPAISMRTVAISAVVLMIFAPESLIDPSFQMSYAAVVALVAAFEVVTARQRSAAAGRLQRDSMGRRMLLYVALSALTSLVAGAMTSPFAAFHFNRVAAYGLAANLMAAPLVSFVIMPAGVLTMILMPFGAEAFGLAIMGWGIEQLLAIAHFVQSWPGSAALLPAWPLAALIAFVLGSLWLCLWQQRWRYWGLAPIALSLVLVALNRQPDILIHGDGTNLAARGRDGVLSIARPRSERFAADLWLRRDGEDPEMRTDRRGGIVCDALGCWGEAVSRDGATVWRVAWIGLAEAALEDCAMADLVVSADRISRFCSGPMIFDDEMLRRTGAVAITLYAEGPHIETVAEWRGSRPWSRTTPAQAQ